MATVVKVKRKKEVQILLEEEFNVEVDKERCEEYVLEGADEEEESLSDNELDYRVEQFMKEEANNFITFSINNEEYKEYELSSQNIIHIIPKSSVIVRTELLE